MEAQSLLLALITSVSVIAVGIDGHNVLFMPVNIGSHIMMHASVAEALVKNGHRASILKHRSVPIPSQFRNSGIDFVDFGTDETEHFLISKNFTNMVVGMQASIRKYISVPTPSQFKTSGIDFVSFDTDDKARIC